MRPHVILIPGLLNDEDLWRDQIPALSRMATVQIADITQGTTLQELAEAVLNGAPARFAVAGFSLGGFVAQEIARIAPERVTKLALLDTSIRLDAPERAERRRELNRLALSAGKFHGFGHRLLTMYLHHDNLTNEPIITRIRAMTERLGPEVFVRQNNIERSDGEKLLRSLKCPVLIACGDSDRLTRLDDHVEMSRLVRNATLTVIPHSGHMTPLENPVAVSDALQAWLELD